MEKPMEATKQDTSYRMIYGKHESMNQYRPIDMATSKPVINKINASMFYPIEYGDLNLEVSRMNAMNPDWDFEIRHFDN